MTEETSVEAVATVADSETTRSNRVAVWALIVLGTVVMVLSTLNSWVERRLLDTDTWVETSAQLLDDDEVRREMSVRLVNRLYENTEVGAAIDQSLPTDLQGLGDPLAGIMRGPLVDTADTLLASGPVRVVWQEANRGAHEAVVAVLEDDVGDAVSTADGKVIVDLRSLLTELGGEIGLPQSVLDALPADAGQFEVVESEQLARAQNAVRVIKILNAATFVLVVACFVGAIYLAGNWRREAIRNVGVATALGGFVVLVALGVGIDFVAGTAETPGGRAATGSILAIGAALLSQLAWSEILIGLLIAVGAALLGPARYAEQVRRYTAQGFQRAPVATWTGIAVLILAILAWSPFIAATDWAMTLIVLVLVVVGIEAIRRVSLAEEATRLEQAAIRQKVGIDLVGAMPAESGVQGDQASPAGR